MLYTYSTEELIGLQDLIIANSLGRHIVVLTAQLKQIRYTITGNK